MYPTIEIFGITLSFYTVFALLGLLVATVFFFWNLESIRVELKEVFIILVVGAVFTFPAAKIVYAIGDIPLVGFSVKTFLADFLHGGIVFLGGMLGAILGGFVGTRFIKREFKPIADYAIRAFPLFHAITRVGCILNGCCYGIPWKWGLHSRFNPGVTCFPFAIFEIVCNLLIFASMLIMNRKRGTQKGNFEFYLISYGICRFVLEFFRGDPVRGVWPDGLSTSQHIAILMIMITGIVLIIRKARGNSDDAGALDHSVEPAKENSKTETTI